MSGQGSRGPESSAELCEEVATRTVEIESGTHDEPSTVISGPREPCPLVGVTIR